MSECLRAPNGDPILVWPRMAELLLALLEHIRVACRAGRKVSKTYGASIVALWWAITHPHGRVIITGPTYRTVQTELWRDLRELHQHARIQLPRCSPMAESGIRWDDGREIRGFSADKPEAASGTSGAELLYIVDEASGMPQAILDTIMGNLAGGGSLLLISNPTQQDGFFAEVFHDRKKHANWLPLRIRSTESPNVMAGKVVVPGLATAEWVAEMAQKWGEDSSLYQCHVLGEFPGQGDDAIIGLALLLEAMARYQEPDPPGPCVLQLGVDVARFGDDESVVAVRLGDRLLPFEHDDGTNAVVHGQDTQQVARLALHLAEKYQQRAGFEAVIVVDDVGVGGGVTDTLQEHEGIQVVGVNAQCVANDEEHYHDVRTELWFTGREWLAEGGKLPDDPELQADLASCRYKFDARGRFMAEEKAATKKRLGRSPDRADAFNLACYTGGPTVDDGDDDVPRDQQNRWAGAGRGFG